MTRVHPTAFVGPGVELDADVVVGPNAVLLGPLRLQAGVVVGPGAVLGTPPEMTMARQNRAWAGDLDHHGVEIGAQTVVRELVTVQQGSGRATRIGSGCWLLTRAYVAHDCVVGEGATLSAGVVLGGHVQVGDRANLGMNAQVHQRRSVGEGAMVGMGSSVTRDVPPYGLCHGVPARLRGVNALALRRAGVDAAAAERLGELYAVGGEVSSPVLPEAVRPAWERWLATAPVKPLVATQH